MTSTDSLGVVGRGGEDAEALLQYVIWFYMSMFVRCHAIINVFVSLVSGDQPVVAA